MWTWHSWKTMCVHIFSQGAITPTVVNSPLIHRHHCLNHVEEVHYSPHFTEQRKQGPERACDLLKLHSRHEWATALLLPPEPALSWQRPGVYLRRSEIRSGPPRPLPGKRTSSLPLAFLTPSSSGTEPHTSCITKRGQEGHSWQREQHRKRRHSS